METYPLHLLTAQLELLARLLGVDDPGGETRAELVWENLPQSWGVFVLLAIVCGLLWTVIQLYRNETVPDAPRGERWIRRGLSALRVGTLLVLLFIFLAPAIRLNRRDVLKPNIVILRDASVSMGEKDSYKQEPDAKRAARAADVSVSALRQKPISRAEIVNRVLANDNHALQRQLESLGSLRAFDFSEDLLRVDRVDEAATNETIVATEPLPSLNPEGSASDLYLAIREGLSDKQTAAIIAFTDGQHTAPSDLSELGADARSKDIPLLLIGVGDPVPPMNLSVSDLYADPQVWKDDPFECQATLRAEGIGAETVQVDFYEILEGEEKILETRAVELDGQDGPIRLQFKHTPSKPGRHSYGVRAAEVENERNLDDNTSPAPAVVKVLDNEAKVLLIAGGPMWEYRNLNVLLTREKYIDTACWLQSIDESRVQAGNTSIETFPRTREELFEYDVILLLDPDPSDIDQDWIDLLKEFVREHAGGVLYMCGPKYSEQFLSSTSTSRFKDLLPVRLGDLLEVESQTFLAVNNQEWPLRPVPANSDHPLLRFYQHNDQNILRWKTLPGVFWSFPVEEVKPAAKPLLSRRAIGTERPLLVAGQFGSGRTLFAGFTGTWRWRPIGHDNEFYNSFWVQTVRWLVEGRAMEGRRRGSIEANQDRYQVGDRIQINAQLKTKQYEPLERDEIEITLVRANEDDESIQLKPVPNQPGRYQSTLIARSPGAYILRYELDNEDGDPIRIEEDYTITLPQVETRAIWLDKPRLTELAEASGGKYFEIDEAPELVKHVPDRTRVLETQGPPKPIWDNLRLLLLLTILLGTEWALRKRFKLL